ncbi:MAG: MFS transporter, partial [Planctomycetota bacterium]
VLTLMSFTQNVYQLAACRLLQGMLTGTVTASVALVASVAPRERSGFALGLMQSAIFIGVSVGPLIGGVVSDLVSYRAAFRVAGLLLLVGGLIVRWAVKEDFERSESSAKEHQGSFGEVLTAVGFLAAAFALFSVRFANAAPSPIFPQFVEQLNGPSPYINSLAAGLLSVSGFAAAISALTLGRFYDSWGHKRLLIVSALFTAGVAVLHACAQSIGHLFVLRVLFGLGAASVTPAANSIIHRINADKNIGKAYGVTTLFTSAALAVGPFTGGFISAQVGAVWPVMRYRAPFLLMALGMVVAAVVVKWRVQGRSRVEGTNESESPESAGGRQDAGE